MKPVISDRTVQFLASQVKQITSHVVGRLLTATTTEEVDGIVAEPFSSFAETPIVKAMHPNQQQTVVTAETQGRQAIANAATAAQIRITGKAPAPVMQVPTGTTVPQFIDALKTALANKSTIYGVDAAQWVRSLTKGIP